MDYFAGMFSPRVMEDAKDLAMKYFKIAKANEKKYKSPKKSLGDAEVKGYARMRKAMLEREKRLAPAPQGAEEDAKSKQEGDQAAD